MIGTTILHYEILELIGRGAMGAVYKARDIRLDTFRALKFIQPDLLDLESAQTHFLREARTQAKLIHPNIATLHELEIADDQTFIVLEYVDGPTLDVYLTKSKPPLNERLNLILQVACALEAAHSVDIIHRDIKPRNILVAPGGTVKVTDFGLAKALGHSTFSRTGGTKGTAPYMAPEAFRGEKAGKPADVWSLGVLAHEVLEGTPPFTGESFEAVAYRILHEPYPPLSEKVGEELPGISAFIDGCLEKDVDERIRDGCEAFAILEAIAQESGLKYSIPTVLSRLKRRKTAVRLWRRGVAVTALVLAVVLGGILLRQRGGAELEILSEWPALSRESSPSWDPTGNRLAFIARTDETGLYIWDTTMPQATPEFKPLNISREITSVTWSPQGSLLAVLTSDSLYFCTADDFRTYPILGGEIREQTWSENGRWLLYVNHTGSVTTLERIGPVPEVVDSTIVDLTPQPITITGLPPPFETLRFYNPIYILEDTRIAFAIDRIAASLGVWTIPAEGGEARLCIDADYIPWFLDWDAEHQRILFTKRDMPYLCGMKVTNQGLSAGEVKSLELLERLDSFDLHAASGKIALSTSTNWTYYIWRTSLAEDLSDREFEPFIDRYLQTFTPAVSRDQDRLFFAAVVPEEGLKLKVYDFTNGEISDLHPTNPLYSNEYFPTPDLVTDRYIAFKALCNNLEGLYYYDTSLGTIGTLLSIQNKETSIQDPSWSADGNSLYYTLIYKDRSAPNTIRRLSLRRTSSGIVPLGSEPILTGRNVFCPYTDAAETMLLYWIAQENERELWVTELSTGERKRLAWGRGPVLDSSRRDVYYFRDDKLMRIRNWPDAFEKQLVEEIITVLPSGVIGGGFSRSVAVGDDAAYAVLHQTSVGSIIVGKLHLPSGRN